MKRILLLTTWLMIACRLSAAPIVEIYPVNFNTPKLQMTLSPIVFAKCNSYSQLTCGFNSSADSETIKNDLNSALSVAGIHFATVTSVTKNIYGNQAIFTMRFSPIGTPGIVRILRITTLGGIVDISIVSDDDGIPDKFIPTGIWADNGIDFRVTLPDSQYGLVYLLTKNNITISSMTGTGDGLDFGLIRGVERHGVYNIIVRHNTDTHHIGKLEMKNHHDIGGTNYVLTKTYIYNDNGSSYRGDLTYYNGLGMPIQKMRLDASGRYHHLVTPIVYDSMLRPDSLTYIPYPTDAVSGEYIADFIDEQANYYNDDHPYSMREYDMHGRVRTIQRAGRVYHEHNRKEQIFYKINDGHEDIKDLHYVYQTDSEPASVTVYGNYPAGTIKISEYITEDGDTTFVFHDMWGKKILERKVNSGENHDTYYVYDLKDSIVCVIQPEGAKSIGNGFSFDSPLAEDFCFTYKYDSRGNVLEKSIPGQGKMYYAYDRRNRVVLYSDALMFAANVYKFYQYNELDQILFEGYGILAHDLAVARSRILADDWNGYSSSLFNDCEFTRKVEYHRPGTEYSPNYYNISESSHRMDIFYTQCYNKIYKETLYEAPYISNGELYTRGMGLERMYYYDRRGRLALIEETDYTQWHGVYSYEYNIAGDLVKMSEEHFNDEETIYDCAKYTYSYDIDGRRIHVHRTINNVDYTGISYSYDNLGNLIEINLQDRGKETYTYDIRGVTTSQHTSFYNQEVFRSELRYQNPQAVGTIPRFSGFLSECEYQHNGQDEETIAYSYDKLGRLSDTDKYIGESLMLDNDWTEKDFSYDMNGNILSFVRRDGESSHEIEYVMDGNRHSEIAVDGDVARVYEYDQVGNKTYDPVNYLHMQYNLLNLPDKVDNWRFTYLSDGTKTEAVRNGIRFRYRGSFIYEYSNQGGEDENLIGIKHDNGFMYATTSGTDGTIDEFIDTWHVKDYLGNVRAVIDMTSPLSEGESIASVIMEQNDYLPFGSRIDKSGSPYDPGNRFRFNGKEEFSEEYMSHYIYGARSYIPDMSTWLSPDPLAEKYYSVSPYVFCNNNPVNFVDPDGKDIWHVKRNGELNWVEGSDDHRLYSVDFEGNRSQEYVTVRNRAVLDAFTNKKGVVSYTASTDIDDLFKVFLFVADNTDVEWALHRGVNNEYILGTSHSEQGVAAYSILKGTDEIPIASVHSHPNVVTYRKERETMGYDDGWILYGNDRQKVYWGVVPEYNYVYFPISKILYNVEYNNPRYIKRISNNTSFYFGTLNYR